MSKASENNYPPQSKVSSCTTQFEGGKFSISFTYVTISNDAIKMLVLLVNL